MTKCSWKTGLFLLAGAFILTFSASAEAEIVFSEAEQKPIVTTASSNRQVQKEIDAFNMQTSLADTAEIIKKRDAANRQCVISESNFKAELSKLKKFTYSDMREDLGWGKKLGTWFDYQYERRVEAIASTYRNDLNDFKKMLNHYSELAIKKAEEDKKSESFINELRAEKTKGMEIWNSTSKTLDAYYEHCDNAEIYDDDLKKSDVVYSYVDPKGNKIFFKYEDGVIKTVGGVTRGCIPLPMKLAESRSCIFCPLFKKIFNTAQDMTTKSYSVLATSISNVLLVGFSLWVAFSLLGKVSSFTKMDAPKYITELLTQAFKVLIAYLLLRDATAVYAYIIGPILKAGMEFGMTLLSSGDNAYLNACDNKGALKGLAGGMLPGYLYIQLECFIQAIQAELAVPQSIGSSLICASRNSASVDLGAFEMITDYRLPDFSILLQGIIIWVFAWLISLAFAFYLIDATVRLGIVGALMPFLVASWPFKMTSKYTSTGFTMFMNTFFTYVFMGLVVSVNIRLMGESLSGVEGGFDAIEDALNGDQVTVLKDILDIGFAGFLILIASCIFGFKLTGQATELAGSMAGGGGGTSIAPQIGGMGASVVKAGAVGARKMAWKGAKTTGRIAWDETKNIGNKVAPKLRQTGNKVAGWLGFGGGSSGGAASTPATSTSPTTPNKPAPAPTTPSNNPPVTNNQQQQAEKLENAEPRQTPSTQTPSTQTPLTQTPSTQPTPTTANQQQTTTSQQPAQTSANDAIEQKVRRAAAMVTVDNTERGRELNLQASLESINKDHSAERARSLENQAKDENNKASELRQQAQGMSEGPEKDNLTQQAKNAEQKANDFSTQSQQEKALEKEYEKKLQETEKELDVMYKAKERSMSDEDVDKTIQQEYGRYFRDMLSSSTNLK